MEFLAGLPLGDLGFGVLVSLFVLAIMTGKLVPKSTVDRLLAAADKSSNLWETAYKNSKEEALTSSRQVDELLEANRATVHLVEELGSVTRDRQET